MANYGLGMGSIICDIFGAFPISTKIAPLDPLSIAEILWKIQETSQAIFKKYHYCTSQHVVNPEFRKHEKPDALTNGNYLFGESNTIFNLDSFEKRNIE